MAKRTAAAASGVPVFTPDRDTKAKLIVAGKVRLRSKTIADNQDELNALIEKAVEQTGATHMRAVVTLMKAPEPKSAKAASE